MGWFGRKKRPTGSQRIESDDAAGNPGHEAMLRYLDYIEQSEPGERERVAGAVVFDLALQLLKDDRGVRVENLFAMLASVGGQQCIAPIVHAAAAGATFEDLGLIAFQGDDGRIYLFGDPPNRLLLESEDSLLSLAFGAAQAVGAPITMAMIEDELKSVASKVGDAKFDELDLPSQHMVDRPTEWARVCGVKIVEALDLYHVPPMRRATAIGYAIQKAFEAGAQTLDPVIAAKIVLQCACRTAKTLNS